MINFLDEIKQNEYAVFKAIPLFLAPRILGLTDRKENSKTYGCADRPFWKYKIKDYVNYRFQEAAHFLALLHSLNEENNPYFNNEHIEKTAKACIEYWLKGAQKNGSVSEVYPFERSFCATSFSAYSITEAMLMLNCDFDERLKKVAEWLMRNQCMNNPNQVAASLATLSNIDKLANEKRYSSLLEEKITDIQKCMTPDGCFIEYSGEDLGYHSITLSLLNEIQNIETLDEILKKGIEFCKNKLDEYGRIPESNWSRNTRFFYPSFLPGNGGGETLKKIIRGLVEFQAMNPFWIDDRYMIPYASNYLLTYNKIKKLGQK
jgi:hypothetical protein